MSRITLVKFVLLMVAACTVAMLVGADPWGPV
jgi:hypothetical protein